MLFLDYKSTSTFALTSWVSPYYLWLAFIILDRVDFSEEIDLVHTKESVDVKDEELKGAKPTNIIICSRLVILVQDINM